MNKKEIRSIVRKKREALDLDFIEKASKIIFEKIKNEKYFIKAKSILSYMDFKNEVKTDEINNFIEKNEKNLILPRVIDKEKMIAIKNNGNFSKSPFGNIEPVGDEYLGEIDLIIVPGVAFDRYANRIGFGRGYYDRFFNVYPNAKRIAVAFEIQVVNEKIETDIFDKKIDILITEENIYRF
ncbi:5-formyltetrahydrofolate cyclo-ligase [Fusobacterium russii]|uniref:5-formyltetrahydrofolate cyclo-ligase n=1 Tax=Fusobacterium russii TaxID=854 RepID=UPI00039BEE68|nr:5-formyltetrahydrofolate cyclo-ligase [Fusobacterium russii]